MIFVLMSQGLPVLLWITTSSVNSNVNVNSFLNDLKTGIYLHWSSTAFYIHDNIDKVRLGNSEIRNSISPVRTCWADREAWTPQSVFPLRFWQVRNCPNRCETFSVIWTHCVHNFALKKSFRSSKLLLQTNCFDIFCWS